MKAISVRQPWAWAIACAGKNVENRSWATNYRGPLLIHAATKADNVDPAMSTQEALVWEHGGAHSSTDSKILYNTRGAIIAVTELLGEHVCDGSCSPWAVPGAHHFELGEVRQLVIPPLVAVGQLGLWNPGNLMLSLIAAQVDI